MNKKYKGIRLFFLIAFLISLLFFRPKMLEGKKTAAEQKELIPTLFVHGYKGSERSFSTMLSRLNEAQWGSRTMMIKVTKQGRISIRGNVPSHMNNPFIQVIFADNRAQMSDQTEWLKKIMASLKEQYDVQAVNLVGHSMGGLALTNFLEVTAGDNHYPKPVKLVTIGSPFKGIEREDYFEQNYGEALIDLKPGSDALSRLVENRAQFPQDVSVLSVAGVVNDPKIGDGLVSQNSALGNRDIIEQSQFNEIIVRGTAATHFGLHEYIEVDKLVAEFLWVHE